MNAGSIIIPDIPTPTPKKQTPLQTYQEEIPTTPAPAPKPTCYDNDVILITGDIINLSRTRGDFLHATAHACREILQKNTKNRNDRLRPRITTPAAIQRLIDGATAAAQHAINADTAAKKALKEARLKNANDEADSRDFWQATAEQKAGEAARKIKRNREDSNIDIERARVMIAALNDAVEICERQIKDAGELLSSMDDLEKSLSVISKAAAEYSRA